MKWTHRVLIFGLMPPATFFLLAVSHSAPGLDGSTARASIVLVDDFAVQEVWKEECAACHGKDGKGQTKAGKRAGVKNFTDPEYQKSWTDADALKVVKTATKDGKKLKNKDPYGEQFSDEQIKELIAYVRTFAAKG